MYFYILSITFVNNISCGTFNVDIVCWTTISGESLQMGVLITMNKIIKGSYNNTPLLVQTLTWEIVVEGLMKRDQILKTSN